jgi:hypothetical protein
VIELGRVSTFRTSQTRSILVRIPERVDYARDFHVRFAGGGRFRGFVLAKADGPVELGSTPYISNVQPGWCPYKGCRAPAFTSKGFAWNFGRYLPAGLYRLYQVADGDMTLTLRIDSFDGVVRAEPTQPVESKIRMLRPTAVTPWSTVYSAGEFTPLHGGTADFAAMGLWTKAAPHVATGYGECFYEPEMLYGQILPRDLAFLPNCPTGENLWRDGAPQIQISDTETVWHHNLHFSISYSGARISGVGGWYDSAAEVHDVGAVGLWLDFQGNNSLSS